MADSNKIPGLNRLSVLICGKTQSGCNLVRTSLASRSPTQVILTQRPEEVPRLINQATFDVLIVNGDKPFIQRVSEQYLSVKAPILQEMKLAVLVVIDESELAGPLPDQDRQQEIDLWISEQRMGIDSALFAPYTIGELVDCYDNAATALSRRKEIFMKIRTIVKRASLPMVQYRAASYLANDTRTITLFCRHFSGSEATIEYLEKLSDQEKVTESSIWLARYCHDHGFIEKGYRYASRTLDNNPNHFDALLIAAKSRMMTDPQQALELYTRAIDRSPLDIHHLKAFLQLAISLTDKSALSAIIIQLSEPEYLMPSFQDLLLFLITSHKLLEKKGRFLRKHLSIIRATFTDSMQRKRTVAMRDWHIKLLLGFAIFKTAMGQSRQAFKLLPLIDHKLSKSNAIDEETMLLCCTFWCSLGDMKRSTEFRDQLEQRRNHLTTAQHRLLEFIKQRISRNQRLYSQLYKENCQSFQKESIKHFIKQYPMCYLARTMLVSLRYRNQDTDHDYLRDIRKAIRYEQDPRNHQILDRLLKNARALPRG
ncbi:hypothetical protein VST7929_01772 [Vibrio stylophorae]|uniref:Tetratricopeptide repeat protein n=1 Tax=Vibrio stylophorae TaxID=659351 RepID=A0ABM8ZUA6_9VIBR|nr:hypothetical protein [Vibrio stylophorae]CAH0533895.1 hypothetical protein VST7929_01772 [Vibrio stylophorae]